MQNPKTFLSEHQSSLRGLLIVLIVAFGFGLRYYVATNAAEAYDEDDYLAAARAFREKMNAGEWSEIPNVQTNAEHPPLVKLLYAAALDNSELEEIPARVPRASRYDLPPNSLTRTRYQSVVFGTLAILSLALLNPLAGLGLAVQSVHLNFSSMAYLDSLPVFFTALMALLYTLAQNKGRYHKFYFWAAAVCFGIAVAAKYPFAWAGVALILHALYYRRFRFLSLVGWGLVAMVVWFSLNPYLWPNPPERLEYQVNYHEEYAGNQVPGHRYLKPFDQLRTPNYHLPGVIKSDIWNLTDGLMLFTAFIGAVLLCWRGNYYGWWLVIGMAFLAVWPTQWIQHKMLIVVPYSMASATALIWLWQKAMQFLSKRQQKVAEPVTP